MNHATAPIVDIEKALAAAFSLGQKDGADNVRASEQCEGCDASLLPLSDGSLPSWFCLSCWNAGIEKARASAWREAIALVVANGYLPRGIAANPPYRRGDE
ncbi:MAG: hypothetical protein AAB721_02900 [Patescibacteria group bacterium]